ncbi:MAG TPA: hypothetical protein VFL83_03620 [Anaeromyxobacter sp.]|nr:hypothetical protein [Anaeromyxobacter sp.]
MATVGTEAAGGRFFARVRWSAVIAGALFALGVHIVMGLIGAALGLAAEPADSRALGAGAAAWALLTPFVATLLGAWLAIRLSEEEDRNTGYVHGVLVWCIGLIAGALFLTGTAASGAMTAGTAASGNLGSAQRMVRGNVGQANATRAQTERSADEAGKAGAAATGGAALAAIAGLLGAVVANALAGRRRQGRGLGWRIAIQRKDERREGAYAGDPGRPGETYRPATPGAYGREMPGERPGDEGATDPYHH